MASIRVTKVTNPITVRIGQRTVKKVVASEKAATTTLATLQELEQVQERTWTSSRYWCDPKGR